MADRRLPQRFYGTDQQAQRLAIGRVLAHAFKPVHEPLPSNPLPAPDRSDGD